MVLVPVAPILELVTQHPFFAPIVEALSGFLVNSLLVLSVFAFLFHRIDKSRQIEFMIRKKIGIVRTGFRIPLRFGHFGVLDGTSAEIDRTNCGDRNIGCFESESTFYFPAITLA
jgi:hypothetical protein